MLWKTLCESYFRRLIPPDACVLELGAGYGHFINHVGGARRIAVDRWPGMRRYLAPGVDGPRRRRDRSRRLPDRSVDFAFASNLFEHLTQSDGALVLAQLRRALTPAGR